MQSMEKKVKKEKQHVQTLREHLTSLQTWEVRQGESLEEKRGAHAEKLIQNYLEKNQVLQEQLRNQVPAVEANETATGQPVQIQAPAKETYKEKRERKRRTKAAQKKHPAADHLSYGMVKGLKEHADAHDNSMKLLTEAEKEQCSRTKVDKRVLRCFVHGFKTNKKGWPASEEDEQYRQQDRQFLEDYISGDVERRRPHLDRIVKELLEIRISKDMASPEYLSRNSAKVKSICDRFTYFDNIWKDPVNKPYFDNLPQFKKDLLNCQILERYAPFSTYMVVVMGMKGVNMDHADYVKGDDVSAFHEQEPVVKAMLEDTLGRTNEMKEEAVNRELEIRANREKEVQLQDAEAMKKEAETMEGDIGGLNLTSFVTGYSFETVAKYREMIEKNVERYGQNQELIDRLYQEIYRGIDALGDVTLKVKAYQGVIDDIPWPSDYEGNLLRAAASKIIEGESPKADYLRDEINGVMDAMEHLLRNKPLSNPAREVLKGMGYPV